MERKLVANMSTSPFEISNLAARVQRLEEKVFKNQRPQTTLSQQVLLLHQLGMLDHIHQLQTSEGKKVKFLARLLNTDPSNTKKALLALPKKGEKDLKIPFNYNVLKELFDECNLTTLSLEVNEKLKELDSLGKEK